MNNIMEIKNVNTLKDNVYEYQNNIETTERRISIALEYIRGFCAQPYLWAGNGPFFDCSGLVCEYLKCLGIIRSRTDLTALGTWQRFKSNETASPQFGDIVIYSKTKTVTSIQHEGIMYHDGFVIEAGGGNSSTTGALKAQEQGAFVRMRPYSYRHIFKFIGIRGLL